jgi:Protein of unknown function (DUF4197)
MKFKSIIVTAVAVFSFTACDQLKNLTSLLAPSQFEMITGLKQALEQGLFKSFDAYSNPSSNAALAFIFPGDAQKIVNLANKAGLGSVINKTTNKFNNAIASSFKASKPIFLNALSSMNITDVANILITDNTQAATNYFKATTQNALMGAFRPIVDSNINTQGANVEWKKIADIINNIPFTNLKVESTLTDFVAARAIDGMYSLVADEEKKIRTDLSFRKTDMMKKVFNYADEQLKLKKQ